MVKTRAVYHLLSRVKKREILTRSQAAVLEDFAPVRTESLLAVHTVVMAMPYSFFIRPSM